MARPVGGPSLPTTPSTNHVFAVPSSTRQVFAKQHLSSQSSSFSSNTSSTIQSAPLSSQSTRKDLSLSADPAPPSSTISSQLQRSNRPDAQQQVPDLLRDLVIPYTKVRNASESSSHEPWNLLDIVNPSMTSRSDITIADLQQTTYRPHTDSGYASSEKSRQRISGNLSLGATYESAQEYPYDEPIGSTAQQDHFLIDQQRVRPPPSVVSVASIPPSIIPHPSNHSSTHCPECSESFNTKSEMSKHMARHNKKYTCDWPNCPKASDGFATKNDLDRHKGSVHHDATVARREYKCCVPGCKDPNKAWERKDNFKAHVKRMHPDEDADAVVDRSLVPDQPIPLDRPSSHSERYGQEFSSTSMIAQPSSMIYQESTMMENYAGSYPYSGLQDPPWPGEGDMYDAPQNMSTRQHQYFQSLGTGPYQTPNSVPSVTMGATTYPSSNTMPTTNYATQDSLAPQILSHRVSLTPFEFTNHSSMNRGRPFDAQSAPVGPHNEELNSKVFEWAPPFEPQSSTTDTSVALDPSLQSGAWQHSSPPGSYPQNIPEQQAQSHLSLPTDEQQGTGQGIDQRRDAMIQKITPILETLSHGEMKLMMEAFHRHPAMSNKSSCTINTVVEAANAHQSSGTKARPYACTRDGCSKRFTAKNIRTKHEKRHDRLFFCTFDGCYSRFGTKDDLRRHEKGPHAPHAFHGYRCFQGDVPTSQHKLVCLRFFDNKEYFEQHRREEHKERAAVNNGGLRAVKNCYLHQGKAGPFWCGFCKEVIQNDPSGTDGTIRDKVRYDHIDNHITKEGQTMDNWVDLKSGGRTKTQTRDNVVFNEESDDDEDEEMAEQSFAMTPTVDDSISQTLSPYSQQPAMFFTGDRSRKRALSDVNFTVAGPAAKQPRMAKYQTSRQMLPTSRGMSDMGRSSLTPTFASASRQTPTSPVWVRCCQCNSTRPASVMGCTCNHQRCHACAFRGQHGTRSYAPSGSGHGY